VEAVVGAESLSSNHPKREHDISVAGWARIVPSPGQRLPNDKVPNIPTMLLHNIPPPLLHIFSLLLHVQLL
jgi:hypothetical protein